MSTRYQHVSEHTSISPDEDFLDFDSAASSSRAAAAHMPLGGSGSSSSIASLATGNEMIATNRPRSSMSEVDLEIVEMEHYAPQSPLQPLQASLAPSLLGSGRGANEQRKRYWRFGLELILFVVAILAAYFIGVKHAHDTQTCDPVVIFESTPTPSNPSPSIASRRAPVILVSFDGLQADLIDLAGESATPNFHALRRNRHTVYAKKMQPQFPTLTFPNHYTIVTGLYPESHGIISNHMYDPTTNKWFSSSIGSSLTAEWWGGMPLYCWAKNFGIQTASVFWVGSDVSPCLPDHYLKYTPSVSNGDRLKQILDWIDADMCELCLVYFSDVDTMGHETGGGTTSVVQAVEQMDIVLGDLVSGLQTRNLSDSASIIVVSDHGMATINDFVYLDDYLDMSQLQYGGSQGAFVNLWPHTPNEPSSYIPDGWVDAVLANLTRAPHIKCFGRENTPPEVHYTLSPRIAPVNCICDLGYVNSVRDPTDVNWVFPFSTEKGIHGFNQTLQEMQAIFHVNAPKHFDSGIDNTPAGVLPEFSNLNVFNLVCHLLNISPSPNNGTLVDFAPYFSKSTS